MLLGLTQCCIFAGNVWNKKHLPQLSTKNKNELLQRHGGGGGGGGAGGRGPQIFKHEKLLARVDTVTSVCRSHCFGSMRGQQGAAVHPAVGKTWTRERDGSRRKRSR